MKKSLLLLCCLAVISLQAQKKSKPVIKENPNDRPAIPNVKRDTLFLKKSDTVAKLIMDSWQDEKYLNQKPVFIWVDKYPKRVLAMAPNNPY